MLDGNVEQVDIADSFLDIKLDNLYFSKNFFILIMVQSIFMTTFYICRYESFHSFAVQIS